METNVLPRRVHESELAGLSRMCPYCKRTVQPVAVKAASAGEQADPVYTLDWFCPDHACKGKTRLK
ncbi:hypothetical protein AB0M29_39775 [Streptomyces sp. NPDC051976]|uniref:hypothetical protein n=1 Tax=Streptomyces sp. NPDC051976 TaxID=3154947 RepID=UPI00341C221B